MPAVPERIWSNSRKLWGNLIPLLFSLPFLLLGLRDLIPDLAVKTSTIVYLFLFVSVGYLATGIVGAWGNRSLARQLRFRFQAQGITFSDDAWFVGFARPAYRSLLDPHEDLGFLELSPSGVQFRGEEIHVQLALGDVKRVTLRPNIHSWLGFGGWVAFEGTVNGQLVRLLVEPRHADTLWGNAAARKDLYRTAKRWFQSREEPVSG